MIDLNKNTKCELDTNERNLLIIGFAVGVAQLCDADDIPVRVHGSHNESDETDIPAIDKVKFIFHNAKGELMSDTYDVDALGIDFSEFKPNLAANKAQIIAERIRKRYGKPSLFKRFWHSCITWVILAATAVTVAIHTSMEYLLGFELDSNYYAGYCGGLIFLFLMILLHPVYEWNEEKRKSLANEKLDSAVGKFDNAPKKVPLSAITTREV